MRRHAKLALFLSRRFTVCGLTPEGPLVRVHLDCGFPLAALLTRPAREEMSLAEGNAVSALVKAPHVHRIPRPGMGPEEAG